MISKLKKIMRANRGFTLLETMIAILILMSAIAGPLTIVQKSLQAATIAKDQDTAYYLAQDAVEYVRFARDTNRLAGGDWLTGVGGDITIVKDLTNCISSDGSKQCIVDSLQNTVALCTGACDAINYRKDHNDFSHSGGTPSIFTRTVSIQTSPLGGNDCAPDHGCEVTLTVIVSWCDSASCVSIPRKVTLRENIFDWE